ncbi:unnamed protein product [Commensalibacter communis]|uniref:hypothetical protein n=1 Tax=Commensalibacter communis TaxID=2972786 RepID=UPI0022FF610E|nr:hypothetical protein [Commensalibacter communis]CAI3960119.1 unnamed protein product [Commensalibacter communis]
MTNESITVYSSKHKENLKYDNNGDEGVLKAEFEYLRSVMFTPGARFFLDGKLRMWYAAKIDKMAKKYFNKVETRQMTVRQAVTRASNFRNVWMSVVRMGTHPIGFAKALDLKAKGTPLRKLLVKNTVDWFSQKDLPSHLSEDEKRKLGKPIAKEMNKRLSYKEKIQLYIKADPTIKTEILKYTIKSAGRSNSKITERFKNLKGFELIERELLVVTLLLSLHNIIVADDKVAAAEHEAILLAAMYSGGLLGGEIGMLLGGPVGALTGSILGSAIAAFLVD